jgi:hypothetical protein
LQIGRQALPRGAGERLPEPVAKELLAPDPLADDLIIECLPDRSEDELAIRRLSARPRTVAVMHR